MDNKHNALVELNARAVSDNIQRASVKCIATFTGLGLKLYSGEDIPKSDEKEPRQAPATTGNNEACSAGKREGSASCGSLLAPAGTTAAPAASAASEFNGKEALLGFCKANALGYPEERTSLMAGKTALENHWPS
jgi:hypothetical protein